MPAAIEHEIQSKFATLSPQSQLTVLEHLVHQLRVTTQETDDAFRADLAAMAADPDIQREITQIEREFRVTENDGLSEL
jgi:hypothetical protein